MKKMEELEEKQSKKYRHWLILLYEDSNSYNFKEVMRIIKSNKKYAYIKHFPESNEKKEHFHVIISLDNATKKSTLSKKLGIQENYIDEVKNLRSICRYLIHKDDDEKYQYNIENVKVSTLFQRQFKKCFDDIEDEPTIITNIYNFIDVISEQGLGYFIALKSLIQYVNINCYDTIYKRYRNEFTDYLKSTCI